MQSKFRLKKSFQFNYIYRKGKCVSSDKIALYYAPNRNNNLKIGVSVSKKVGKSTVRNRIKRVFKEACRSILPRISVKYNYILVARMDAQTLTFNEVVHTLESLLEKAKLLNNEISNTAHN